jgi:hypothetical protein
LIWDISQVPTMNFNWLSFTPPLVNFSDPSLSLSQASIKSKPCERDLGQSLSDPSIFKQKHFTDDLCIFVTLRDLSPRRIRRPPGATNVVASLKMFVLPSPTWRFDSGKLN